MLVHHWLFFFYDQICVFIVCVTGSRLWLYNHQKIVLPKSDARNRILRRQRFNSSYCSTVTQISPFNTRTQYSVLDGCGDPSFWSHLSVTHSFSTQSHSCFCWTDICFICVPVTCFGHSKSVSLRGPIFLCNSSNKTWWCRFSLLSLVGFLCITTSSLLQVMFENKCTLWIT